VQKQNISGVTVEVRIRITRSIGQQVVGECQKQKQRISFLVGEKARRKQVVRAS